MTRKWTIRMFGELRAERGDRVISRFSRKTGSLLSRLAYPPLRAHPRERLIDLLWGDEVLKLSNARGSLNTELGRLRNVIIEPDLPAKRVIEANRNEVWLNADTCESDIEAFEAALNAADRADSDLERGSKLEDATRLYRGELLPDMYDEWVLAERYRLAEMYLSALRDLLDLAEATGNVSGAIDHATAIVSADPLDEASHRALMRSFAAAGRIAAADRQYAVLVRILESELGVEPDPESVATIESIRSAARGKDRGTVGRDGGTSYDDGTDDGTSSPDRHGRNASEGSGASGSGELEAPGRGVAGTITALTAALDADGASDAFRAIVEDQGDALGRIDDGWGTVTFGRASTALAGAHEISKAVGATRIGIATGEVEVDGDMRSILDTSARLALAARTGRIVVAASTAALARTSELSPSLFDRGIWTLEGAKAPIRIFELIVTDISSPDGPPISGERAAAGRLPARFTRFFGREEERDVLSTLLDDPDVHLLTLLGPAGVGKTRLALETAEERIEDHDGAVFFAALADLEDGSHIADHIALALGARVPPGGDAIEAAVAALADRPALLVLDNAEHLVEPVAEVVGTLIERVPSVTIFVTSQRRLGLRAERILPLGPLPVPEEEAGKRGSRRTPTSDDVVATHRAIPSVALFENRAREAFPEFHLMARNVDAVAEICRRLDGVPLAIELAASRIAVLSPAKLVEHLDDRFELLVSRHRDGDPRHRALQTAIEWTTRLLDPDERRTFAQLSIFRGGFSLDAAVAVCTTPDAFEVISRLVEASLVQVDADAVERRFRMLESLRAYGAVQLGPEETATLQGRHAAWVLDLAERAEPKLKGSEQAAWLDRLDLERENLRAALDWCIEAGEHETGLGIGGAIWRYWFLRGALKEGREWLDRLIGTFERAVLGAENTDKTLVEESTSPRRTAHLSALHALGTVQYFLGERLAAEGRLKECLAVCRIVEDRAGEARALNNLAMVAQSKGEVEVAVRRYQRSLEIKRSLGDSVGVVSSLVNLASLASSRGDRSKAREFAQECLEEAYRSEDRWLVSNGLLQLGLMALNAADLTLARRLFGESKSIRRSIGDRRGEAIVMNYLAEVAQQEANRVEAIKMAMSAQRIFKSQLDSAGEAESQLILAQVAYVAGDMKRVRTHLEASFAHRESHGDGLLGANQRYWLAKLSIREGDLSIAWILLSDTLTSPHIFDSPLFLAFGIDIAALHAMAESRPRCAVILISAVSEHRSRFDAPRLPTDADEIETAIEDAKKILESQDFRSSWTEGQRLSLEEAAKLAIERS